MSYELFKLLSNSKSFIEAVLRFFSFFMLLIFLFFSEKYLKFVSTKISISNFKKLKKLFKTLIWLPLIIAIFINDFLGYIIGSFNFVIIIIITVLSLFLNFQVGDIIKEIESNDTEN